MGREFIRKLSPITSSAGRPRGVTRGAIHTKTIATSEMDTYLAGYRPFAFRADEASKPVLVDKDEDLHRDFAANNAFRRVKVKSSLQKAVPEVDPESSLNKYHVVDRLAGSFIPDVTEKNATHLYRPRQVAAERCKTALDREMDVWEMLTDATKWHANNQVAMGPTTKWNGGANSNPIGDLKMRIVASAQLSAPFGERPH